MRVCTVCKHEKRREIDRELVAGASFRAIAGRYTLSKSAVERHKSEHLPARMLKGAEKRAVIDGRSLLEQLAELGAETRAVLEETRSFAPKGDACEECRQRPVVALRAIQRLEKQLELQGRLLGELKEGPTVNVLVSPEWVALRSCILGALSRFPDAQKAVSYAIQEAGGLK